MLPSEGGKNFEFGFSSDDLFQALGPADAQLGESGGLTAGEAQQLLQAALARGDLQLDSDGTPTGTPALKPCANPADTAAGVDGAPARNGTTTPPAEEVPPGTPPNKEAAGKALRLLLVSPLL